MAVRVNYADVFVLTLIGDNMLFDFNNRKIKEYITSAEYGLERESLRVTSDGKLAMTPHPFTDDPHIDRDFCENQTEIISDVFNDADSLFAQLEQIQDKIGKKLSSMNEVMWAFSNPPVIGREEDIPVAVFKGELEHKNEYRKYLAEKYGKKKMLFSGIHFNFSFSDKLLRTSFNTDAADDFGKYKSDIYLRLSKRLVQYSWLVVFLTAASPVTDPSFGIESNKYSSVRCGEYGYWNNFIPLLDYSGFEEYIASIEKLISDGKLSSVSELYYPVRLKPRGSNTLETLKNKGVNHIELRVLDVNPLSRVGIIKEDILFIHLLLLYLSSLPEFCFTAEMQTEAVEKIKQAAVFGSSTVRSDAAAVLKYVQKFTAEYFPHLNYIIDYQINKLSPGHTYAEIISREFSDNYISKGLSLSIDYRKHSLRPQFNSVLKNRKIAYVS